MGATRATTGKITAHTAWSHSRSYSESVAMSARKAMMGLEVVARAIALDFAISSHTATRPICSVIRVLLFLIRPAIVIAMCNRCNRHP